VPAVTPTVSAPAHAYVSTRSTSMAQFEE